MAIPAGLAKWLIRAGIAQRLPDVRKLLGDGVHFLKYYSRRTLGSPNVELKQTRELLDVAAHAKDLIDLSLGAPPLDPHLLPLDWSTHAAWSGYPPVTGLAPLREAIARKLATENQLNVSPEQSILVCNGVSQGISLFLDAFVDAGERVVLFDPTFFIYRLAVENRGARVVPVRSWLESGEIHFEERELQRALRGARAIIVNSPANPTGGILPANTLERLAWWCRRFDTLIFSDEVYERFIYTGSHYSIGVFPDARTRTITANGFSKSHGLAAFRVGYLAGHHYLIQPIIVSFLATAPFVSVPAQLLALTALAQPMPVFRERRADYDRRRQAMVQRFQAARISFALPVGAFYFWVSVADTGLTGLEFAKKLLAEKGVMVMDGQPCGPSGKFFIRVSYAGDEAKLREGITRLIDFYTSLGGVRPVSTSTIVTMPPLRKSA